MKNLISQLLSGNPDAMIKNLVASNPKVKQALPIVQRIISEGGTKEEQLVKACKVANLNYNTVKSSLIENGIDLM